MAEEGGRKVTLNPEKVKELASARKTEAANRTTKKSLAASKKSVAANPNRKTVFPDDNTDDVL